MEILGAIVIFLIIIVVVLLVFIPSLAMVFGMGWVSKKIFPHKGKWVRWGVVIVVLLAVPQILNVFIERDISRILSQSHGKIPSELTTRVLAVSSNNRTNSTAAKCGNDCILLLLSGEIEQYLVIKNRTDVGHPSVTGFRFEKTANCSFLDDLAKKRLSARLENTVRELSLSGTCLTASETTVDIADTLITYNKLQKPSRMTSKFNGHDVSVLQKSPNTGEWTEFYRDVGLIYDPVFPVLLPAFALEHKKARIDVLRRKIYRTKDKKSLCREDWFSDFPPCHRQQRKKTASAILGISVSEYKLEKSGIIPSKSGRTQTVSNFVKAIVLEERKPTPNEWALIQRHISHEYNDSETFARLVIEVMSSEKFPVPNFFFGTDKFDENHKAHLAIAVVNRIGNEVPGPEIGNSTEKQQWYNLYKIVEKLPVDVLEPHFDDLVNAVPKRPNQKTYVEFFKKFGSRSRRPILDIIAADRRRLKSLGPVMCKMGSELSGIEDRMMEMAQSGQISLNGNYGQVIYFLLDIGVEESRILDTLNPQAHQASSKTKVMRRFIHKYRAEKNRCR